MKKNIVIAVVLLSMAFFGAGAKERSNSLSIGSGLINADGDFGFQGTITSPWFKNSAAFRIGTFILFRGEDSWIPYYGFKAGFLGGSFMVNDDIRLYGEGGVVLLFPSSHFDNDPFVFGGYGHFGFEFFPEGRNSNFSEYIELGSNGIAARAENIPGSPVYMNGFASTVGLRYYF